jgi:hypothetical protein
VLQPLDAALDRPRVNGISLRWSHIASEPSGISGLRVDSGRPCRPGDANLATLRRPYATPRTGALCAN